MGFTRKLFIFYLFQDIKPVMRLDFSVTPFFYWAVVVEQIMSES